MKPLARRKPGRPKVRQPKGGEIYQGFREAMQQPGSTFNRNMLAYLANLGDAEKAGKQLKISPTTLRKQASEGGWDTKVQTLLEVREKDGQHAFAKQLNRLFNLNQAVRMRVIIDQVLGHITEDADAFKDFLSIPTKAGRAFSAKALLEISKALQSVQAATYAALADQTTERIFDKKEGRDDATEAPQLGVFKALAQLSHASTSEIPKAPGRDEPDSTRSDSEPVRDEPGGPAGGVPGEPAS